MEFHWLVPHEQYDSVLALLYRAAVADAQGDTVQLQELCEEIKFLPGYPLAANPIHDTIVVERAQQTTTIYTGA